MSQNRTGSTNNAGQGLYKLFRVAVLGAPGVGKTCLIERFVDGAFNANTRPTIEDTYEVQVKIENTNIQLHIMDTPGKDILEGMADAYIKRADGFVLVFSLTDTASLHQVQNYLTKIDSIRDIKQCPIVVIANKSDPEAGIRTVLDGHAKKLCDKFQVQYREVSARVDSNVALPFVYISKILSSHSHKKRKKDQDENITDYLSLASLPSPGNKGNQNK